MGFALLAATPAVDLALLALTYADLSSGKPSNFIHGLSALYIGYSLALGPTIIRSLDVRFAKRFGRRTSGSDSADPMKAGGYRAAVGLWKRTCAASLISIVLLVAGLFVTGPTGSFWLIYWIIVAVFIPAAWWFIGPQREKRRSREPQSS